MAKLKLALIGCGFISELHWVGIKKYAKEIEVTAVVDIDLAKAKNLAQIISEEDKRPQVYSSLEEALKQGDFDAVDIMLPHDLHEEAALKAFSAGKHVLLEKPIAPSLEACIRIFKAADTANTVFMVGENAQYWPEIRKTKELIQSGAIGTIVTASANFIYPFDKTAQSLVVNQWRSQISRTGGGIVIDGGSHWLRPLRMWLGEVHSVSATVDYPRKEMEGESLCHALLKFQSGVTATFSANMASSHIAPQEWWRITGDKGQIVIEAGDQGRLLLFNAESPAGNPVLIAGGYASSFGHQLWDFSQAVLYGKPLDAEPDSALLDLQLIQAMYRSAETKRWKKVKHFMKDDLLLLNNATSDEQLVSALCPKIYLKEYNISAAFQGPVLNAFDKLIHHCDPIDGFNLITLILSDSELDFQKTSPESFSLREHALLLEKAHRSAEIFFANQGFSKKEQLHLTEALHAMCETAQRKLLIKVFDRVSEELPERNFFKTEANNISNIIRQLDQLTMGKEIIDKSALGRKFTLELKAIAKRIEGHSSQNIEFFSSHLSAGQQVAFTLFAEYLEHRDLYENHLCALL